MTVLNALLFVAMSLGWVALGVMLMLTRLRRQEGDIYDETVRKLLDPETVDTTMPPFAWPDDEKAEPPRDDLQALARDARLREAARRLDGEH